MDIVNKTILQKIYSDDIIFHYTKAASAIDYILYQKKLRFTHRKKSNDPIENEIFRFKNVGIEGGGVDATEENEKIITDNYPRANEIYNSLKDRAHSYHQICFCCNTLKKSFLSNFSLQAEEFGFTKPRMWEQYADNYGLWSSRQRDFHPKPLTEPYVTVSRHTALVIQIYTLYPHNPICQW